MKESILSEEINSIKYLLGYNRGLVISEQQTTVAGTPATEIPATGTPIKIGVQHPEMENLQILLNTKYQAGLTPDGKYGPKTSAIIHDLLQHGLNLFYQNKNTTKTPPVDTVVGGGEAIKKTDEVTKSPAVATNSEQNKNVQGTNAATVAGGGQSTLTNIDDIVS